MKAIVVKKYGNEEVMEIVEREVPKLDNHEILIKQMATSISPVDIAFRKGEPYASRLFTGFLKPKHDIPGDIISGLVEAVGNQVSLFKKGDRVFGHSAMLA